MYNKDPIKSLEASILYQEKIDVALSVDSCWLHKQLTQSLEILRILCIGGPASSAFPRMVEVLGWLWIRQSVFDNCGC